MASLQQQQYLSLDSFDDVETFFLLLESKFSIENIPKDEDKVLTLISLVSLTALKKIHQICLPKKATELTYKDMKEKIMNYVKPTDKLIWAERTKFFSLKQDKDETIQDYVTNLRKQAENCDFDSLKQSSNLQELLVVNQLITGVHSRVFQERILESAQPSTAS